MKIFLTICLSLAVAVQSAPQQRVTERPIAIISQNFNQEADGSYQHAYETENGIRAEETGTLKRADSADKNDAIVSRGSYSYTSPEGDLIEITYTADDNGGFVAQGAAIPTPPPIPPEIQKALDLILSLPPDQLQSGFYKKN